MQIHCNRRSHRHLVWRMLVLAHVVYWIWSGQTTLGVVISFEQSEGFPAPVLIPDPAPVSGAAMAGFSIGMEGGLGYAYEGVMDLDNSANMSMDSFYYANRGNGPPRLWVEYYGLDESLLGVKSYTKGTVGHEWIGVGPNFEPKFQLIATPPLSMAFRSRRWSSGVFLTRD